MNCRQNVSQMTNDEKSAYVDAVLALKAESINQADLPDAWTAGARNRYDVYVWIHMLVAGGAHGGPAFVPWHREFLKQFELELQHFSSNPKLTIPYWDWIEYKSLSDNSADSNGVGAGFPFTDGFMGGMGTGTDNRVETGKFAEIEGLWTINVRTGEATGNTRDNTTYLRRLTGQDVDLLPTTAELDSTLTRNDFDSAPFREGIVWDTTTQAGLDQALLDISNSFRKSLEYFLHNGPHGWIGGNMMPQTSPNDPTFFLHHCNVDKIWAIWQQRNPTGINNYQPASGLAGHALNATMTLLQQSFFLFPVLDSPSQLLNHKSLGFIYDTDLPEISILSSTLNFGVIPENTTTYLPIQFDIQTCRKVKFRITAIGGDSAFQIPDITTPYEAIVLTNEGELQTGEVYIKLNATTGTGILNGAATIEAFIEDSSAHYSNAGGDFSVGSWMVNFQSEVIARPQSAICLVLDKSGSMDLNDGTSLSRFQMLENAVGVIRDILRPTDGVGMVYYDTNENRLFDITQMSSGGTTNINNALSNTSLIPDGNTAIGKGIIEAADVLIDEINSSGTPYSNYGMLVLTDGNENITPFVSSTQVNSAISGIENDIYAVGLGNQGGVSEAVLNNISRYILITGQMQGDERQFRLTNYFVQILADIKKNDIVLDPMGKLIFGLQHEIEFNISEADIESDIILLSPFAPFIEAKLISPDGNSIQGSMGNVEHLINQTNQIFRVAYPATPTSPSGSHSGKWKVVMHISKESIKKNIKLFLERMNKTELSEVFERLEKYKSIPYSLSVQSYSDLKFTADVHQTSNIIGSEIQILASLNQYRLPISGDVVVEFIKPNGKLEVFKLSEVDKGQFQTNFKAEQSGLYHLRIKASGYSIDGVKFTRETLRSISIFKQEPKPPTNGRQDNTAICSLMECFLSQKGAAKFLKENKIDSAALRKCFKKLCNEKGNDISLKSKTPKLNTLELMIMEKIKPIFANSSLDEIIYSLPEMKEVKFVDAELPKFSGKSMIMPAFKLNKKGKMEKIVFDQKPQKGRTKKK